VFVLVRQVGPGLVLSTLPAGWRFPRFLFCYVVFLRVAGGKMAFLREYFDPTRASKAMNAPILGLESPQKS
jgi:hypothetical protein